MTIKSVEKAMKILFVFTVEERLLGVSELSDMLALNQSTVHHLATSLESWGLLEQDPLTKKYRLGIRLIELAGTMLQSRNLAQTIQPYLHHIADTVMETAYLGVLVDDELLNVEQICGPHLVQYAGWQGRRTPVHCTSAGKVLLAHLPESERERILREKPLRVYTARTITNVDELSQALSQILEQGYALSIGELDSNINAVAVPVKGPANTNQVIAALAVVGPAYRFTKEKCLDAVSFLQSVAQEVSGTVKTENFKTVAYAMR